MILIFVFLSLTLVWRLFTIKLGKSTDYFLFEFRMLSSLRKLHTGAESLIQDAT